MAEEQASFPNALFTIFIMISPMIPTEIHPSAIIINVEIDLNKQYMLISSTLLSN